MGIPARFFSLEKKKSVSGIVFLYLRLFFYSSVCCTTLSTWKNSSVVCLQFVCCLNMDLHTAAKSNLERVQLLVEQGADKDKGNIDGHTPLRLSSLVGHLKVVQYLVEQGASLDKVDNYGVTPLSGAAYRGHVDVARYLLEQGADRDKADDSGWTPLHYAAHYRHLEIAMLLMSYGADLNARTNRDQLLPIDLAANEEIKQAIRDEPRRRMDHGHKRATEQDRHLNAEAAAVAAAQEEEREEKEDKQQSNNRPRLDKGAVVASEKEETKIAEEDEDSEPSSDDEEDDE